MICAFSSLGYFVSFTAFLHTRDDSPLSAGVVRGKICNCKAPAPLHGRFQSRACLVHDRQKGTRKKVWKILRFSQQNLYVWQPCIVVV